MKVFRSRYFSFLIQLGFFIVETFWAEKYGLIKYLLYFLCCLSRRHIYRDYFRQWRRRPDFHVQEYPGQNGVTCPWVLCNVTCIIAACFCCFQGYPGQNGATRPRVLCHVTCIIAACFCCFQGYPGQNGATRPRVLCNVTCIIAACFCCFQGYPGQNGATRPRVWQHGASACFGETRSPWSHHPCAADCILRLLWPAAFRCCH